MSSNSIDNITVIGAGTMGHGIAQAFATSGFNVNLVDVSDQVLNTAFSRINDNLSLIHISEHTRQAESS